MLTRFATRATFVSDSNVVSWTREMFLKIFRNISCVRAARNGVAAFRQGRATSQDTMCPRFAGAWHPVAKIILAIFAVLQHVEWRRVCDRATVSLMRYHRRWIEWRQHIADVIMFLKCWLVLPRAQHFVADTNLKCFWKSSETFFVSTRLATMLPRFATDGQHRQDTMLPPQCVLVLPGPFISITLVFCSSEFMQPN